MAVPRNQTRTDTFTPKSQPAVVSRGVCDRISKWIWSGWGSCESHGPSSRQPHRSTPTDCKACREWKVPCDHAQPQCDHCYQQQILCFYVNPDQPKRKGRPADASVPRIREPTPRKRLG